jgi:hypothetical protein
MFKHRSLSLVLTLLVLFCLTGRPASARQAEPAPAAAAIGTAFTYQGQLKDAGGSPVTNTCDFQFRLYDDETDGSQVGSTLTETAVPVSAGLFTVQLDFGASAFTGSARWLKISVRCPAGGGSYEALSPRQPLTPAPFSLYSSNSDKLDGQHASAFQKHYDNLIVVAKSGGDYTTITAALNAITDASAANPYLVYVAPGVYTEHVTMKSYVDIEGAGEGVTKITSSGNNETLSGADHAELRFLTVENTSGPSYSIAIYNPNTSPHLTHVTAIASGGTVNIGVENSNSSAVLRNVTASATGGSNSIGIYNNWSPDVIMTDIDASASDGTENDALDNSSSSVTMVRIVANAWGGDRNIGVANSYCSPTLIEVVASAWDGKSNYGAWNTDSSLTFKNSVLQATGGSTSNTGINNYSMTSSSQTVKVINSTVSGITNSISGTTHYTTYVGGSQLVGGSVGGAASYLCVDSYSGGFTALPAACH